MKQPLTLLGCALVLALSACTQTQNYARVVVSAERATLSPQAGDASAAQTPYGDITYILQQQKDGTWQLIEQSCGLDPANQHIRRYGTISEEEAQRIRAAAQELARTQKGTRGTPVPPGGASSNSPYNAQLFTQASMAHPSQPWLWKTYESGAEVKAHRQLLATMRAVAKKHGSVLPLVGELADVDKSAQE